MKQASQAGLISDTVMMSFYAAKKVFDSTRTSGEET